MFSSCELASSAKNYIQFIVLKVFQSPLIESTKIMTVHVCMFNFHQDIMSYKQCTCSVTVGHQFTDGMLKNQIVSFQVLGNECYFCTFQKE